MFIIEHSTDGVMKSFDMPPLKDFKSEWVRHSKRDEAWKFPTLKLAAGIANRIVNVEPDRSTGLTIRDVDRYYKIVWCFPERFPI